jgi:hypothetical protein
MMRSDQNTRRVRVLFVCMGSTVESIQDQYLAKFRRPFWRHSRDRSIVFTRAVPFSIEAIASGGASRRTRRARSMLGVDTFNIAAACFRVMAGSSFDEAAVLLM